MYRRLFVGLILVALTGRAFGGAALITPNPWSTDESSTKPCGAGKYTSTVSATYYVGVNQSALWWAESGAGYGAVHARIDTTGETSFANGLQVGFFQPTITSNGMYNIYFIVPYAQCTGTGKTCTMQFWTDSGGGWYACATIAITCTGCSGGEPVSRDQCLTAQNLNFCSSKDGDQVYIPTGETVAQIDGLASHYYGLNIADTGVFTKGNTAACQTAYKEMMCELYLAPCGNSKSSYTTAQCQQALTTCGITQAKANLYNCSIFSNKPTTGSSASSAATSGPSSSSSSGSGSGSSASASASSSSSSSSKSSTTTKSSTTSTTSTTTKSSSTVTASGSACGSGGSTTSPTSPPSGPTTSGSPSTSSSSRIALSPIVSIFLFVYVLMM
eukprot:Phypoly_transcript_11535.p1 GENE.Phypoly_transcript_11535~~Phypoly_transcript_11535.p1  ORF type:complete len:386 (+),score=44.35 Phypoly_transcript_11535:21-1178(+)